MKKKDLKDRIIKFFYIILACLICLFSVSCDQSPSEEVETTGTFIREDCSKTYKFVFNDDDSFKYYEDDDYVYEGTYEEITYITNAITMDFETAYRYDSSGELVKCFGSDAMCAVQNTWVLVSGTKFKSDGFYVGDNCYIRQQTDCEV